LTTTKGGDITGNNEMAAVKGPSLIGGGFVVIAITFDNRHKLHPQTTSKGKAWLVAIGAFIAF
jgi:hypothetical protein